MLDQIKWIIKAPSYFLEGENWFKEVSALRGKAFFDHGKRPNFRQAHGEFRDQDQFETLCYHVLAYHDKKIVGTIRILPLEYPYPCVSSLICANDQIFIPLIEEMLDSHERVAELNRLAIDKNYKEPKLAFYLIAVAMAVKNHLGCFGIGNSNRYLFDRLYSKVLGAHLFSKNAGPYFSTVHHEEMYLFYFDKEKEDRTFFLKKMIEDVSIHVSTFLPGEKS